MTLRSPITAFLFFLIGFCGYAIGSDTQTDADVQTETTELVGNVQAGEERYKHTCINCHGPAGRGAASYPKISGKDIPYTVSKLETYREGTKIGPNSSLMIMMARPLTDEEILNLAAYLKEATN